MPGACDIRAWGCNVSAREVKYQCPGHEISVPGGEMSVSVPRVQCHMCLFWFLLHILCSGHMCQIQLSRFQSMLNSYIRSHRIIQQPMTTYLSPEAETPVYSLPNPTPAVSSDFRLSSAVAAQLIQNNINTEPKNPEQQKPRTIADSQD